MSALDEIVRRLVRLEAAVRELQTVERPGAWVDWTPTVTQPGAVAATVDEAKYALVGKVCHVQVRLTVTGAGTGGDQISIGGQPTIMRPALTGAPIGVALAADVGTADYWAVLYAELGNDWRLFDTNTRGIVGANPNFALAAGDVIAFEATYRVA